MNDNYSNNVTKYVEDLEIRQCNMYNNKRFKDMSIKNLSKILTPINKIETLTLEFKDIPRIKHFKKLFLKHLPNIKTIILYFSGRNKFNLTEFVKIGIIRKIPISFRLICKSKFFTIDIGLKNILEPH